MFHITYSDISKNTLLRSQKEFERRRNLLNEQDIRRIQIQKAFEDNGQGPSGSAFGIILIQPFPLILPLRVTASPLIPPLIFKSQICFFLVLYDSLYRRFSNTAVFRGIGGSTLPHFSEPLFSVPEVSDLVLSCVIFTLVTHFYHCPPGPPSTYQCHQV